MHEVQRPDDSIIVDMTNGEKLKVRWSEVTRYLSKNKAKNTVVTLGWGDNAEDFIVDMEFLDFDEKYDTWRKAEDKYWESIHHNNHFHP